MDPLANIAEQRDLATRLLDATAGGTEDAPFEAADYVHEIARLAELVLALDQWRSKGGFDPYLAHG